MRIFTVQSKLLCGSQQSLNIRNIEKRFSSTKAGAVATRCALALTVLSALLLVSVCSAEAQTLTTLYNFTGGSDGGNPDFPNSSLTPDGKGNFFGTTLFGGLFGDGTVFELAPNGHGGWNEIALHSFNAFVNGGTPTGPLAIDREGNLYGVARFGVDGQGVIFEVSPVGTGWTASVIYNFMAGGVAFDPFGGLIIDPAGNLYGTAFSTQQGLSSVIELSPSDEGWTLRVLYAAALFTSLTNRPTVTMDAAGDIFGSQFVETSQESASQIFELSPNGKGGWNANVIYTLHGNEVQASGPLVFDSAGNLYGATVGIPGLDGSIFKLTPEGNGKWTEKTIFTFGGPDGGGTARFVIDAKGNIFGTSGIVLFELVAPAEDSIYYKEKILFKFPFTDGISSAPVLDNAGNLFATTSSGGWASSGTAYEVGQ